jgi:hypothetical protein
MVFEKFKFTLNEKGMHDHRAISTRNIARSQHERRAINMRVVRYERRATTTRVVRLLLTS